MKAEDQIWVLSELVSGHNLTLETSIATHCKCMSCWVYVLNDVDGRVCEAETLEELIEEAAKRYNIEV